MTLTAKPKSFGPIFASFNGTQTVHYCDATSERSPHPPDGTPVDMLLASLAYCMVRSVEWAAKSQDVVLHPFSVKVMGRKAANLPGRVEVMTVTLIGDLVDDPNTASEIVKIAKGLCTVSNTLTCEIIVTMESNNA